MSYESFTLEKDGHVANMTLCRGESFNTMTKKFWIELPEILNEINRDPDLRAVVMSSTGKHFCAGMDLANFDNGVDNISPEKKPDHARKSCIELLRSCKAISQTLKPSEHL